MENHNEITDAIPYFGNEEGVEAIIIKKPTQQSVAAKPIIQESKTIQVNETKSIPFRDEKTKNKFSKAKPVLIILIVLAFIGYLAIQGSLNNNSIKLEQETQDSLAAANAAMQAAEAAAMQAASEAVASDSLAKIENFELPVPPNYTYLKDIETDWRDGEMIVPQGMLWSIAMMYNYGGEPDAGKSVASNLCHREVGKKTVDGVVGGGMFKGQHQSTTVDDYVYLTINNKDFYWDDLNANYVGGKAFDMLKKFQIRRFSLPSGTSICFPSRDNGGPPGYFTFFISEYSTNDSTDSEKSSLIINDKLFQGKKKFCDKLGYIYYIVEVEGINIKLTTFAGPNNEYVADKRSPISTENAILSNDNKILIEYDGRQIEGYFYIRNSWVVLQEEDNLEEFKECSF